MYSRRTLYYLTKVLKKRLKRGEEGKGIEARSKEKRCGEGRGEEGRGVGGEGRGHEGEEREEERRVGGEGREGEIRGRGEEMRRRWKRRGEDKTEQDKGGWERGEDVLLNIITSCVHLNSCI